MKTIYENNETVKFLKSIGFSDDYIMKGIDSGDINLEKSEDKVARGDHESETKQEEDINKLEKEAVKKETERKSAPRQAETARRSEPREEREVVQRTDEEIAQIKATALEFLSGVFKAMELPVEIQMEYNAENGSLEVDFAGEDMGILIGKRGQTLDSLQYLTSLVVNKEQKDYVRVKLDTENYRKRRKETLENLARNIAYKVKKTRRPVSLEPMNPYERRIIHSALQGNKFVETYSEGSEPYRHVVVAPKR